jgi:hypothetical protein
MALSALWQCIFVAMGKYSKNFQFIFTLQSVLTIRSLSCSRECSLLNFFFLNFKAEKNWENQAEIEKKNWRLRSKIPKLVAMKRPCFIFFYRFLLIDLYDRKYVNSYHQPIFVSQLFGDKCCLVFGLFYFLPTKEYFFFLKNEKEFIFNYWNKFESLT